jgi:hypothetical protein
MTPPWQTPTTEVYCGWVRPLFYDCLGCACCGPWQKACEAMSPETCWAILEGRAVDTTESRCVLPFGEAPAPWKVSSEP